MEKTWNNSLFATRMFQLLKQYSDLEWLQERFGHMQDFLSEAPAYQWILEEGRQEEKAHGLAQMRQTVVEIVQERFPELAQLAEEVVATIDDLAKLGRLSANLGGAQDAVQARKILSELAQ